MALRKGVGVVPPQSRQLAGEAATEADVERGQSLLSVEHGGDLVAGDCTKRLQPVVVPLVVVKHEAVEPVGLDFAASDPPEQKGTDRIASHEAVEESRDLRVFPDQAALDGGQCVFVAFDGAKRLDDGDRSLKRHAVQCLLSSGSDAVDAPVKGWTQVAGVPVPWSLLGLVVRGARQCSPTQVQRVG